MTITKNQRPEQRGESADSAGEANGNNAPGVVVGVGASAGGLAALEGLFANASPGAGPGAGVSFVVIQHLSPKQPSILADLLRPHTGLRIVTAEDGMRIEADTVYIVAPNTLLRLQDGRLKAQSPIPPNQRHAPVDVFLESLAADQGERAAAVVLSGTGSDGTRGTRAIKEHSGVTIAQAHPEQNEASQFHGGMPDSAVASGLVDQVLPVEKIAPWIERYAEHLRQIRQTVGEKGLEDDIARQLGEIIELVLARTGRDFRSYKTGTLTRRIQRRLLVRQMTSVASYIALLGEDPEECQQLVADFLIGVTRFFRDSEAFDALDRSVIAKIVAEAASRKGGIRVWVAGCATGEEAYSIAILLRERLAALDTFVTVQIFATDVDADAITQARGGRYPSAAVAEIAPARLSRFFACEDGGYRVGKELRDICIFSVHDLTNDPPFSRMDLICCRNVLIYMQPELQKRLLAMFHYALRPGGYLWLGPSEAVPAQPPLFEARDKKHRVFVRRDDVQSPLLDLPLPRGPKGLSRPPAPSGRRDAAARRPDIGALARELVAEQYAPAYAVVDGAFNAVFLSGGAGRYLEPPTGRVTANILSMARAGLQAGLRSALHRAARSGTRAEHPGVRVAGDAGEQRVAIFVEPMEQDRGDSPRYLVVFQDESHADVQAVETGRHAATGGNDDTVRLLERELEETKESLRVTVEELESSYEELQSSNEELLSMNEELQSSNEELGTSKEELQSVNEELETVNQELSEKVRALSHSNSDLKNLLNSTQLATVFLDRDLRVRWFNPAATDVFRLRESDYERPLTDLATKIDYDRLESDARRVLRTLESIERAVASADGRRQYVVHVSPYRTVENVIDGVTLVCVDVTARLKAEADLEKSQRSMVNLLEGIGEAFLAVDKSGTVTYANRKAERLLERPRANILGQPIRDILADFGDSGATEPVELTLVSGERVRARVIPSDSGAMIFLSAEP